MFSLGRLGKGRLPTMMLLKNQNNINQVLGQSRSNSLRFYCPTPSTPMKPVGVQLWEIEEAKKQGSPAPTISYEEKDELFDHPLYSPIPKVNTGGWNEFTNVVASN